MSLDISSIINVTARISAAGLSNANFGTAVIFAENSEKPASVDNKTMNFYSSLSDLGEVYPSTTEVYKAAKVWFSSAPNPGKIQVYQLQQGGNIVDHLNEARQSYWWYITIFNKVIYQSAVSEGTDQFSSIVDWGEANDSMILNCVSGTPLTEVLDSGLDTDICSILKNKGARHCFSLCSNDPYAAVSLAAIFGSVNYSVSQASITGNFKKLSTPADEFTSTQINTIESKKGVYYTSVDSSGSVDVGRVFNSVSSSSYGEFIDNIFDLDAFINQLQTALYNALTSQVSKLPQTPDGQDILIKAASRVGQDFIDNGYLGARKIIDSLSGEEKETVGYEMLSKPEDILDLSDSDRAERKSAPIKMALYPAGAIHSVDVTLDVY